MISPISGQSLDAPDFFSNGGKPHIPNLIVTPMRVRVRLMLLYPPIIRVCARIDRRLRFPFSVSCQPVRTETGMPIPVIRLSALHPTFASVR
jgi:hypothetical protein